MNQSLLAVSDRTWSRLVDASHAATAKGWATPGVFATAVGPEFVPGSSNSLLYVGKSGGPLIFDVGLQDDQQAGQEATTRWMIERRNPSAFWRFADMLVTRRQQLAWSNLAKIDVEGSRPPGVRQWKQIEEPCLAALREEMQTLDPRRIVFATHKYQRGNVLAVLQGDLGFTPHGAGNKLPGAEFLTDANGRLAAIIRHPQGWHRDARDPVAQYIRDWA